MPQLLKLAKALNNPCKYMKWFIGEGGYNEGISGEKMETFQRTKWKF